VSTIQKKISCHPGGICKGVRWGAGFNREVIGQTRGGKKEENVERDVTDEEEARAVFQGGDSPQKRDSLLVLFTSFPRSLGNAVFEFPWLVGTELLEDLEAGPSPFVRPSSPCLSGHS
jgi:hypothetical protein